MKRILILYLSVFGLLLFVPQEAAASTANVSVEKLSVTVTDTVYNGKNAIPSVIVKDGSRTLVMNRDYTMVISGKNAGFGTVIITGRGSYSGTRKVSFKIKQLDISKTAIITRPQYNYGEVMNSIPVNIAYGGYTLVKDVDYTVTFPVRPRAGETVVMSIKGKGSVTGTVTRSFTVTKSDISSCSIAVKNPVYSGREIVPDIVVKYGGMQLIKNKDYEISLKNNKNAGTGTVIITGKENYKGMLQRNFTISKLNIQKAKISVKEKYSYSEITGGISPVITYNGNTLKKNTDFTVTYSKNPKVGKRTSITIKGTGNCTGTISRRFMVTKGNINTCSITVGNAAYTGKAIAPPITVKCGKTKLKKGRDYTVSFKNNINAGKAQVTIKGSNNFSGSRIMRFTIKKASLKNRKVTIKAQTYSGKRLNPSVKITGLKEGRDYTVSYKNNINAGKAYVIIKGKGSVTGTKKVYFKINRRNIKDAWVGNPGNYQYTGKEICPSVNIRYAGKELVYGKDYTVSYKNNTAAGTAYITVAGRGNYKGKKTVSFSIYRKPSVPSTSKPSKPEREEITFIPIN